MKNLKTLLLCGVTAIITAVIAAQAQVPGVNSTLNSVFTLTYELSTSKPTYSATFNFTPPALADDVCTMQGSATKTIRLRRLWVAGYTGLGTADPVAVILRAAYGPANGGSSVIVPNASYNSTNSAATAVIEVYSNQTNNGLSLSAAAPTATTITSELMDVWVEFPGLNTANPVIQEFDFGMLASPVFLRGTTQLASVSINHITLTTGAGGFNRATMSCTWEWTEDNDS